MWRLASIPTDAVNVSQLSSAFTSLNSSIQSVQNEERRGIAAATAARIVPTPQRPGGTTWALNGSVFQNTGGFRRRLCPPVRVVSHALVRVRRMGQWRRQGERRPGRHFRRVLTAAILGIARLGLLGYGEASRNSEARFPRGWQVVRNRNSAVSPSGLGLQRSRNNNRPRPEPRNPAAATTAAGAGAAIYSVGSPAKDAA